MKPLRVKILQGWGPANKVKPIGLEEELLEEGRKLIKFCVKLFASRGQMEKLFEKRWKIYAFM